MSKTVGNLLSLYFCLNVEIQTGNIYYWFIDSNAGKEAAWRIG